MKTICPRSFNLIKNQFFSFDTLGLIGLYLFAFGFFFKVAQANQGMILMLIALLPRLFISERQLIKDPVFLMGCIFLFYLLCRALYAWQAYPLAHDDILYMAKRWALSGPLGIFIVAYWCHLRSNIPTLLLLALSGLLLRIILRFEWQNADTVLNAYWLGEQRASFGFSSNNLGIWSAIAMIGLIVYARPFFTQPVLTLGWFPKLAFWMLVFSVLAASLFFSQTRASWLAFFVVLPITLFWQIRLDQKQEHPWFLPFLALMSFLGLLFSVLLDHEFFSSRLYAEQEVIAQILTADINNLPATSIGQRVEMYRLGWQHFLQRPLLGWGPGLAKTLLATSEMDALIQNGYIHFHSIVFDLLVQLGLIGTITFMGTLWFVLSTLTRSYQKKLISSSLLLFVYAGLTIYLIAGLVSEPLLSASVPYFPAFMGGLAYMTRFKLSC